MILTGRAALAAAGGAIVVLLFGTGLAVLLVDAVLVVLIVADLVLAASLRPVAVTRSGDTRVRLGQAGTITLTVANNGRRRLRARLRDGWRPSAGAAPARALASVPAGRRITLTTTLIPVRRGDITAGQVTIRSIGPLGLAGRQRNLSAPWSVRVLPAFLSRKHLPGQAGQAARTRRPAPVADQGSGQRVRLAPPLRPR